MRILITGANGQLGRAAQSIFTEHEVLAVTKEQLDITSFEACNHTVTNFQPDVILHAAAWTDVRKAEVMQNACYEVNLQGTYNLVKSIADKNCIFVHVSTDFVFEGKSTLSYVETDAVNPVNVYGRSKLASELVVQDLVRNYYIVRTSWVFGDGKNFVKTILQLSDKQPELNVLSDQTGSPTYAVDLAVWIQDLIELKSPFGVYHAANAGEVNWADFAREILTRAGKENQVRSISTAEYQSQFQDFTPKPKFSVLNTGKLRSLTTVRSWQAALTDYIDSLS